MRKGRTSGDYLDVIRQVRETLAARFDYDLHRMVVHLQEAQVKHGDRLVPTPKQARHRRTKPILTNNTRNS